MRHRDKGLLSDTLTHSALQINVFFPSIMLLFKEIVTEITQTECSEGGRQDNNMGDVLSLQLSDLGS